MPKPKILILTIPHGAAHTRVANSLKKALLALNPQATVAVENGLARCARWFRAYYDSYEIPLKLWPSLWGWIENFQHHSTSTGPGWLYREGGKPLFKFLEETDPDIVIATEVGMCELSSLHKRQSRARYMLVGATAGVDLDHPWIQPEVDLYPTFPAHIPEQLRAAGVPPERILPCGTPIDTERHAALSGAKMRHHLAIPGGAPLLLVMFGGTGFGKPRRMFSEIRKITRELEVVFVAGKNRKLEQELRSQCGGNPRYRVLGWVDNIPEWMAAADLLLTKPGGATVVEAVNAGLPILAFDPLPGAERRACDLIEQDQLGRWVRKAADLAPAIEALLAAPEKLEEFRKRARALARPHAAHDAAEAILKLCAAAKSPASP
jgi:processive 1,2-diacylglycerol beta-glucosyltransferase